MLDLLERGVELRASFDKVRYKGAKNVLTPGVLETLRKLKWEILDWLAEPYYTEKRLDGSVEKVRIHPMRPQCREAGRCLGFDDCDLFPLAVFPGWCRERAALQRKISKK